MDHTLPVVCTVKAIYAFTAKEEGDLTLNKGDIIKVHDNDGGWWKGTLVPSGLYGNFPSNFVEMIDDSKESSKEGSTDSLLSATKSQSQSQGRQHSRQGSVDSSKFTKRKPVKNATSSTTSLPYTGSSNTSNVSLGASTSTSRNPQAIIGDSGLCSTMPGAFPESPNDQSSSGPTDITDEAVYNPGYTEEQQRLCNSIHTTLLNPSSPATTLPSTQAGVARHVSNRSSMPNLAHQQGQQNMYRSPEGPGAFTTGAEWEHAGHGPRNVRSVAYLPRGQPMDEQNFIEEPHHLQSGMTPRMPGEFYSQHFNPAQYGFQQQQQPFYGYGNAGSQQLNPTQRSQSAHPRPGYRHSVGNIGLSQPGYPHLQQGPYDQYSELSLENLAKHNRSQGALDSPKSQGLTHGRSRSQANMRPEGAPAFNPYDYQQPSQQQQQQQQQQQPQAKAYPGSVSRKSVPRTPNFNIVIPQPKGRPQSIKDSSPVSSSPASAPNRRPGSPQTPGTAESSGTPMAAATSMSNASATGVRDFAKRGDPTKGSPSAITPISTTTTRKSSMGSVGTPGSSMSTSSPDGMVDAPTSSEESSDVEFLSTYQAKKPKSSLIRAFKQIINPKKVAEKDALRSKNEHSAWIEMKKSLKRVGSPEPGKERPFFDPVPADGTADDPLARDPFDVLKKCQVMRDAHAGPGATIGAIDFGPNTFAQVDKVARNVNQRGNHLTPQLLSQKYLTRPYSKSPLSKLRVLFVWVSENIKLEGGTTRDVSGGRYKLGPASDQLNALTLGPNGGPHAADEPPSLRVANSPAAKFVSGLDEYARSFLREDEPEQAQDVLTRRTCKTGEGFANLFAEMALAAGIEDVGVVKGYLKGPMDVFTKDVPPPNHAWNVVRIDGTYRFIDCCLASPFHPAHYPNRPQVASSFYFLTSPMDLVMSHAPVFLTYQYITPSIPPHVFLQLPFVRPAYFEFGLSLPDFKRRSKLEIKDDEPVEVVVRIDGGGGSMAGSSGTGHLPGLFSGECLGRGCGEGIELRAEVEVMTAEGKIVKKRALAQVMILNPYQNLPQGHEKQSQVHLSQSQGPASSMASVASSGASSIAAASNRSYQSHHCTGIRIAKIKAVLPPETVVGPGGVRKGVVHIYAGRKVENAPTDAKPYSLALTLPIQHTGTMPKTPFSFVHHHFSPYEFYVKSPQAEMLYAPNTYKFSIVSLAAQAQAAAAAAASASTIAMGEDGLGFGGINNSTISVGSTGTMMTSHSRHLRPVINNGGVIAGASSMSPLYKTHATPLRVGTIGASAQSLVNPSVSSLSYANSTTSSIGTSIGTVRGMKNYPYQHAQQYKLNSTTSMTSSFAGSAMSLNSHAGPEAQRSERLVLRTQSNRVYKLLFNPVRQCHEAQIEVKERGIWECVRMDEGGKNRVGREGAGGVVIASWMCV